MKIVITGALGHIGSQTARLLPALFPESETILIDDLSTQRYPSLFNLPTQGSYSFIEGDVLKLDLKSLFSEASAVIHLNRIHDTRLLWLDNSSTMILLPMKTAAI